jgi:hypothetical protein
VETYSIDLSLKSSTDKANERNQDGAYSSTNETILGESPKSVSKSSKDPNQEHSSGACYSQQLNLVLNVVELGWSWRRERMKQDVGRFDSGPGSVKVFHVGIFNDDLSTGGRIPYLILHYIKD